MSAKELADSLIRNGVKFTKDPLRSMHSSLDYLTRRGFIKRLSPGKWTSNMLPSNVASYDHDREKNISSVKVEKIEDDLERNRECVIE